MAIFLLLSFQIVLIKSYEISKVVHYMRVDDRSEKQRSNVELRIGENETNFEGNELCYKSPLHEKMPIINTYVCPTPILGRFLAFSKYEKDNFQPCCHDSLCKYDFTPVISRLQKQALQGFFLVGRDSGVSLKSQISHLLSNHVGFTPRLYYSSTPQKVLCI